jgi:hypothetical protein
MGSSTYPGFRATLLHHESRYPFMNTRAHDHDLDETPPDSGAGLWAVFWRMLLFGPFVVVFGMLALIAVVFLTALPLATLGLLLTGHSVLAVMTMIVWLAWLKFGGSIRRHVSEGFEHASL